MGKTKSMNKVLEKCWICQKSKDSNLKAKVALPKENEANEVVSLDLKVLNEEDKPNNTSLMSWTNIVR